MKNKSLLDKCIESLSYDELMEYLGTQGLRGITLPVYEGKTPYECLCAYVKQVMVAEETKLLKNDEDCIFKYKYEIVSAVQYINLKEEDIKNRFDNLPSWLDEYIHDNMIQNCQPGCDPIVICSSYKDNIQSYGHEKHLLKQGDWIVRTMKDNNTFCYSDDLFKWFYEKE